MEASPRQQAQFHVLPESVEKAIKKICDDQSQPPISDFARKLLADIGENAAMGILDRISTQRIAKSFSGYIVTLVKKYHPAAFPSPSNSPSKRLLSPSSTSPLGSPLKKSVQQVSHLPPFEGESLESRDLSSGCHPPSTTELRNNELKEMKTRSQQLQILSKLQYGKLFLVLSYIGRQQLEEVVTVDDAKDIVSMNNWPMTNFEAEIWKNYGTKYCDISDRSEYLDWNSGKTYFYYCYVHEDGSYHFKGPSLNSTRTHLQRSLGDDNILIVKFSEHNTCRMDNIAEEGIRVGLWRFRFFAFKDKRKRQKKNLLDKDKAPSCALRCYFVRLGSVDPYVEDRDYILSGKSASQARGLFMHIHTVVTMEKYMARFSLILSTTIKLQVDLGSVTITDIQDIPFRDDSGSLIYDENGKALIHTDGTGYISEDLAMKCPKDFSVAKYIKDNSFEAHHELVGSNNMSFQTRPAKVKNNEPPLLMQCRLFHNGRAVKGTLLINKTLKRGEIQIRPSMIKVERDPALPVEENFNSLEIVATSHRPGRTFLSENLISLLSYGGVPRQIFLDLLTKALEDTKKVYSNKHAALRVASNRDISDYGFMAEAMILSGIPLNEPFLHCCLWNLKKDEKSNLRKGKIPISESFYLMGTADPTGLLDYNQVCVILDSGQVSGKVLVYRNPGLHFGDIHVMEAIYVKELEDYVGDSKYGIFFSTKGCRSAPYEMATGDFDGDMYWVSRHPKLLKSFKANEPWSRVYLAMHSNSKKPLDFSSKELEYELFCLFLEARKPSFEMPTAADSWLAFMDRLLTLGDDCTSEKDSLMKKMIQLIDIYYDALDAPKRGKRVSFPNNLRPEMYPHHMGKRLENSYHSTSILGEIYDSIEACKDEATPNKEIWKLPCFDIPIPENYVNFWKKNYDDYRSDMRVALNTSDNSKNSAANEVIYKYKKMLYDAPDMEESTKDTQEIYKEALAIYHVTYDYAKGVDDCGKCNFAWRVAGTALCNLYAWNSVGPKEKPLTILPSILREVLS